MAQSSDDSHEIHIMLLLVVLPFLYFIFKQLKSHINPVSLPPGPTSWPILGTLPLFQPLTHISLSNLSQSYGPDLMLLRLGTQNVIVGSSPSAAAQILKANDRILSARAVPHAVPLTRSQINKTSFWADPESDHWKNIRTICRKELFSAAVLETQAVLREQKMVEMVEWLRSKEGKAVNVQNIVFATVFNIFSNVLFSKDVVRMEEEFGDIDEIRGALSGIIQAISAPNWCESYPFLGKLDPQGLRRKHREMSVRMWALWETTVKERRESDKGGKQDFLDALVSRGFTDDQINKLFEELFSAGIDTTTSTINRTMLELLNSPESMTRLKRELEIVFNHDYSFKKFHSKHLPYLEAAVKETLRLHPPAPLLLSHRATDTCQVLNYTIPKNARVIVNVWAIGRDPKVWDYPLEYRPERFLNSTRDFKGNDFEFLPFSAGRRICPGLPMAVEIVPLIVGSLMYYFEWSCLDGAVDERLRATSQIMQPLLLIPEARK